MAICYTRRVKGNKGAFSKPIPLKPPLSTFVKAKKMSRGQIIKAVWKYAKSKGLQEGRFIKRDKVLDALFPRKVFKDSLINGIGDTGKMIEYWRERAAA